MARRPVLKATGNETDADTLPPTAPGEEVTQAGNETEGFDAPGDAPAPAAPAAPATAPAKGKGKASPAAAPAAPATPIAAGDADGDKPGDNKGATPSTRMQLKELKRNVLNLGMAHGAGKTSMIALAEAVTEAAQDNIITEEQTEEIYDRFREGVKAKSSYEDAGEIPDEAAGVVAKGDKSKDQQLSKLRQFIILGGKFDTDALDLVRRARNLHIGMLRDAANSEEGKSGIKPGSTYAILVDVARAQLNRQKEHKKAKLTGLAPVMTDADLKELMSVTVNETEAKTGQDKLLDVYLAAKSTEKGTAERNPLPSDELAQAIYWLEQALINSAPETYEKYKEKEQAKAERAAKAQAAKDKAAAEEAAAAAAEQAEEEGEEGDDVGESEQIDSVDESEEEGADA